jgi:hypothetical protein
VEQCEEGHGGTGDGGVGGASTRLVG